MTTAAAHPTTRPGLLDQPRAVWAVAFACVVAFMGIGLVDPILPVIARQLDAGPSQVSLLFTSYFAVTGLAMLVTGFVSSRIGARRTLLCGLALVVGVIVAGGFLGVVNTVLTGLVMEVSPVERPVASAAYSFVRFTGGAVAPYLAGRLAEDVAPDAPFLLGAVVVLASVGVLLAGRRALAPSAAAPPAPAPVAPVAAAAAAAS